ncbi:MAG: flavodoxin domain-containing protein [Parafilimonas sp.]
MMNGIIIYTSKYGATKQYAEWLGEMLNLPAISSNRIMKDDLEKYDYILLGTPVYFGKFKLKAWLRHNIRTLINKKLLLFIVNATTSEETEKRNKFIEDNVPRELRPYCKFFFVPGRVIHEKLTLRDKLVLRLVALFEKDPVKKKALYEDLNGVRKEELLSFLDEAQLCGINKVAQESMRVGFR